MPRGENPLGTGVDADFKKKKKKMSERTLRTKQLMSIQRKK